MKNCQKSRFDPKLVRQLGLFDSTMMMVGIVIGSGIFLTTGIMAKSIPSASLILLAWIVGGLITLAGALTYAELGAAMPEAGGQYVYLREAYGPLSGFLFGWVLFLVTMAGSIAALGIAFAEYFGYFFPFLSTKKIIFSTAIKVFKNSYEYSLSIGQVVAIAVIIFLSAFNYIGVVFGKIIQNIATVIKIGTLLVFIFFGFMIGKGTSIDFTVNPTGLSIGQLIIGFGVALVAVTWAFDGWNNISYAAGEIKNPKRNLPFSLVVGTVIITVLYALTNYVYLYALPIDEMTGVVRIAEKAATSLYGSASAGLLSAAVLISVFGALNGAIFVGSRVYYAMASDKLFFRRVAKVHPRFRTPAFAILIQAVWACILTVSGTFEQLFTYVVFITVLFYIATAASVFTLRKKYPDLPRPYKTWGYPVIPIVFIIASFSILLNTLIEKPVESLAGLGFTIIGIPVYYLWKKKGT
ncbi:MAG: amino acid permease [Candidatus Aminicenantes bacterium]|nr:MAG: amino acid permease [Candidatus Aminicenantes bacterium]